MKKLRKCKNVKFVKLKKVKKYLFKRQWKKF